MDEQILTDFQKYFKLQEVVDKQVFNRFGVSAWKFFDIRLLETMVIIREELHKPIRINNWDAGLQQRGLRHNRSQMVIGKDSPYCSAHIMGKAFDFDVKGMTAVEVRDWIVDNEELFPYKIRLENKINGNPISWVHLDVFSDSKNDKIYKFNI